MKKACFILIVSVLLMSGAGFGQANINFEQYHVVDPHQLYTYMPVMHYQTKSNWYGEARYNYEDVETFSLFLGRAFTGGNDLNFSVVPMLGGSVGKFKGVSTGLNVDMDYNKFFFSSQSQYSMPANPYGRYFWYSWSEVGYQSMKWLYAGLSVQHTHDRLTGDDLQPGMMIGFTFNKFTIPVYTFDPFGNGRNFIVGFNMAWKHTRKKQAAWPVVKNDDPATGSNQ